MESPKHNGSELILRVFAMYDSVKYSLSDSNFGKGELPTLSTFL